MQQSEYVAAYPKKNLEGSQSHNVWDDHGVLGDIIYPWFWESLLVV